MRFAPKPRLPWEPLRAHLEQQLVDVPNPAALIADLAGVSRRTVHRWPHDGIPLEHADRILTAWGTHPTAIYGTRALDRITYAIQMLRQDTEAA